MIEIAFSTSFKRAFKTNPHDPRLKTHKLSGKLSELWSFSVDYDLRVIFHFVTEHRVLFLGSRT